MNVLLLILSFFIVGFGQPAFSFWCSLLASIGGYAIFFEYLINVKSKKRRFWIATGWFSAVQLVQLSWMISHPYLYIYGVYGLSAFVMGLQFGVIGLFIEPGQFKKIRRLAAIAGAWVLLEWSRLFILSGFSWGPVGMALSSNVYSLQLASIWGIYGLSFWVIFVNLLALRAFRERFEIVPAAVWACAAAFPFLYGAIQLHVHDHDASQQKNVSALLVQTAFPIEETLQFSEPHGMIAFVLDEWKKILHIVRPHFDKKLDVVVLPEFTVPYGTYSPVFPYPFVEAAFREKFGPASLAKLPALAEPLASKYAHPSGDIWMVNNAFWSQGLANIFNAEVVVGLEDAEDVSPGVREYYSSAMHFMPRAGSGEDFSVNRYNKRVLVPMGEYIPFSFCRNLAASYGIGGSFTPGEEAKVFGTSCRMGMSICYEETFGHLMRENKQSGAEVLLNITSDVWYPNSRLPQQHFDHARLRTVENGLPLLRACNTGVTSAIDSLGRVVAMLGEHSDNSEDLAEALHVQVPIYNYWTLYSKLGDTLIISLSIILVLFGLRFRL